MTITTNTIEFDLKKYIDFDDFTNHDDLFRNDLRLLYSDKQGCWYVSNDNTGKYFSIEHKYHYMMDFNQMIIDNRTIKFHEVIDEEEINELKSEDL